MRRQPLYVLLTFLLLEWCLLDFVTHQTTFQKCMQAIFYGLIEKCIEVFMDDFSIFGLSFDLCLKNFGHRTEAMCGN